jgi:hypothetical protein
MLEELMPFTPMPEKHLDHLGHPTVTLQLRRQRTPGRDPSPLVPCRSLE